MSAPIAVVDVGGTYLRSAQWCPGEPLRDLRESISPSVHRNPGVKVAELRQRLVREICDSVPQDVHVAGVSFGAALDHRNSTVYASAPLWGPLVDRYDLAGALSTHRPDVEWTVVNDVTAALLHVESTALCENARKVLLVTISTGIACRIIDRRTGAIPVDELGLQGEIGHLPASATLAGSPAVLLCDCGQPNHVSAFSSGPGIRRLADLLERRSPERWNASLLSVHVSHGIPFERAFRAALDASDALAGELLETATSPIATILRTALCVDPEMDIVALAGGVANALSEHYVRAVLGQLERQSLYLTSELGRPWPLARIVVCGQGSANNLIGAGLAVLQRKSARR
ncbi:ROK family protein [Pendulispora brunnea]|uniref:ROK family protein n=1 Tax=Pendulispora brunnea TaxID=2905690 RepID=A0ABZ2KG07_9BACT